MDAFGYVSVIISVFIGLSLSHLLTGTVELIKARQRVKFYWTHLVWILLTFVGNIFLWWTMWNLRLVRGWNFFTFLLVLLAPILLYVAAAFLIPRVAPDGTIDLRTYFYQNRGAFFGVNAAFTALMGMENWLLTGRLSPTRIVFIYAVWFALLCVGAIVKSALYHAALAVLFTLMFLFFIVLFGLRLGTT